MSSTSTLTPMNRASPRTGSFVCSICGSQVPCDAKIIHHHWFLKGHAHPRKYFGPQECFCLVPGCDFEITCTHSAFVHFSEHFRVRERRCPKWLGSDLVARYNRIGITTPSVSPAPAIAETVPMNHQYGFPSPNDFSSRLSTKIKNRIKNCGILDLDLSEEAYRRYVDRVDGIDGERTMAKSQKTVKAFLWKTFKQSFSLKTLTISDTNAFKYADLREIVHFWINDPVGIEVLRHRHQTSTAPYLSNLDAIIQTMNDDPNRTFSGLHTGTEWYSVLKRTQSIWEPEIATLNVSDDTLFLHLGLFWDGFQKYRQNKSSSVGVLIATLLEFSPSLRWRKEINALAPIFFSASESSSTEFINTHVLPLITAQLDNLSKGISMYSGPLGRNLKVFAYVTEILGDHPGRAAIMGVKANLANFPCQFCDLNKDNIELYCQLGEESRNILGTPRDPEITRHLIESVGTGEHRNSTLLADNYLSVNFQTECLSWPGVEIPTSIAADFFHSEISGDLIRHFLKLIFFFIEPIIRDVWEKLSNGYGQFVNLNKKSGIDKIKFKSEASFCQNSGMIQYHVMRVAPFILTEILDDISHSIDPEVYTLLHQNIELFTEHLNYVSQISAHEVKKNDLDSLYERIHIVHDEGWKIYKNLNNTRNRYSKARHKFLSINSHTTYHYRVMLDFFGCTSCFSTLCFESKIGEFRRLCDRHRSRHNSQITLIDMYWTKCLADFFLRKQYYHSFPVLERRVVDKILTKLYTIPGRLERTCLKINLMGDFIQTLTSSAYLNVSKSAVFQNNSAQPESSTKF